MNRSVLHELLAQRPLFDFVFTPEIASVCYSLVSPTVLSFLEYVFGVNNNILNRFQEDFFSEIGKKLPYSSRILSRMGAFQAADGATIGGVRSEAEG